ncbi:MAG: ABC transporter ATP-binding protein/permease [Planctomycetales bacterium]|nr:ABC transporter ATP-binding protein/permease [Planctomycetales bacterium]
MTGAPGRPPRFVRRLRRDGRRLRGLAGLLAPHARAERRLLAGGAALALLLVALRMAQPWPLKWVFDSLAGHPAPALAAASVAFLILTALAAAAEFGERLVLAAAGNRMVHALRTALFGHVLRLPLSFHERRGTGELLTRVVSDTARLRQGVNGLLVRGAQSVLLFVATIAVLLFLSPLLALVAAGTVLAAVPLLTRTGRRILRAARRQRSREGRLAGVVEESLLGVRELQAFRPAGPPDPRFEGANRKSLRDEQKLRRLEALLLFRMETLLAVGLCAVLWLGTREVRAGGLTAGDLVLFLSYVTALQRPFLQIGRQAARTGKTLACSERLRKVLGRAPGIADAPGAVPADGLRGEIAFEAVRVRIPKRRRGGRKRALHDVALRVSAGERVAICGPNGAGKSTLLRLVPRLLDPREGRVLLDGRDAREYRVAELRRAVSAVFQEEAFFGLSVRDNIALARPEATETEVAGAARRARLDGLLSRLPKGLGTRLRRRGGLLSAGERQRLAVARALLRDGRIWLLDEPTAGLDAESAGALEDLLLSATEGRTALWVTHDRETAARLGRVLWLEEGRLVYDGPAAGLDAALAIHAQKGA